LVVFKELGLMFNPSNLSDTWTENHTNIAESVTNYLNSDHRSNSWPLNETQTLFKNLHINWTLEFRSRTFYHGSNCQSYKGHSQTRKWNSQLNVPNEESRTLGVLGSLGGTFALPNFLIPNIWTFPKSNVGTLYRLFQLQPFPWVIDHVPMLPQNQTEQILAIPINDQSEPIQFSVEQLHLCKQVKSLFSCDIDNLTIKPTHESCLVALANKHYSDANVLCHFTISHPTEILYQLQPYQYLLYLDVHQPTVYQCIGKIWSGITITARISFLTLHSECDLNLNEHHINNMVPYQPISVIEIFSISSVMNRPRKSYIRTQTIIKLVAFCILIFYPSLFLSMSLSNV
jgi:hypothetical protein